MNVLAGCVATLTTPLAGPLKARTSLRPRGEVPYGCDRRCGVVSGIVGGHRQARIAAACPGSVLANGGAGRAPRTSGGVVARRVDLGVVGLIATRIDAARCARWS